MMLRSMHMQQSIGPPASRRSGLAPRSAAMGYAAKLPTTLTIVIISLFVPVELSFFVLGLRLTLIRALFLVLTPVLLVKLARKISEGRYRFVFSDLFVVSAGFWMIYAPANVDGLAEALNHAGPNALEFCVGYMVTRILLSEHGHALRFIELLCRTIAIVALLALLDPLTNHYWAHELSSGLTGIPLHERINEDSYRLGLLRATGPVEHAILLGFTSAIGLLLAVSVPMRLRGFIILSCGLGAIFAFSSGPIMCIFFGFGLLSYNRVMSSFRFRWLILITAGIIAIIAAFLMSNSPIGFIISHFIYSPASGYYREWTWDRVIFYVSQSPWYGLGYGPAPDEINHSIDSLWLVLATLSGYPGAALVALSLIGAVSLSTNGRNINLVPVELKLTTTLGILIFLIWYIAFIVHLWGSSWILAGLLAGTRAHLGELGRLSSPATQ
jgi:hypothetical protein